MLIKRKVKTLFIKIFDYVFWPIIKTRQVYILSPLDTELYATVLKDQIIKCGIKCNTIITNDIEYKCKIFNLYIVLCGHSYKHLPPCYIFYNFEQSTIKSWWGSWYIEKLKRAIAVFDYSPLNIRYLKNNIGIKKIFYIPVCGFLKNNNAQKNIDLLFYGRMSNRRKKILKLLKDNSINVYCLQNVFSQDIQKILLKTKIVLNIHKTKYSILESIRIFEAISNNCLVISETSFDKYLDNFFKNNIIFVNSNNLDELVFTIKNTLNNKNYKIDNKQIILSSLSKNYICLKNALNLIGIKHLRKS